MQSRLLYASPTTITNCCAMSSVTPRTKSAHPPAQPWEVEATAAGLAASMNPAEPQRAAARHDTKSANLMVGEHYATAAVVPTAPPARPSGFCSIDPAGRYSTSLLVARSRCPDPDRGSLGGQGASPRPWLRTPPCIHRSPGNECNACTRRASISDPAVCAAWLCRLQGQDFGGCAAGWALVPKERISCPWCGAHRINRSCGDRRLHLIAVGRQLASLRWVCSSGFPCPCKDSYRLVVGASPPW